MASFVARLMSLNAHELQCLHSDSELMRHLKETQLLMENRLQNISFQSKFQNTLQQQSQQHQITPTNYYDYYSQAVALSAVASQQHQQQLNQHQQQQQQHNLQLQLLISSHNHLQNPLALDLRTTPTSQPLVFLQQQQHQQQHLLFANSSPTSLTTQQLQYSSPSLTSSPLPATTTTTTPSNKHQNFPGQDSSVSKKIKLSADHHQPISSINNSHQHQQINQDANSRSSSTSSGASSSNASSNTSVSLNDINNLATNHQAIQKQGEKRNSPSALNNNTNNSSTSTISGGGSNKKYKGEFDEPTPSEVEERQRMLARSDNYHNIGTRLGECACVLGSQFKDKSTASVLASINEWRHLDTEERIKSKWDVVDLPKDIPLSDIKKYEDLRREASNGRADFGGASKRKPLGIRGTRQFLLILYCLWGHPGRDDVMQKEGYCPHCFAKIKKANEQSTLVRVVNHFNMKHRRGANPRLSPNRDTPTLAASMAAKVTKTTTTKATTTAAAVATKTPPTTKTTT